MSVTQTANASYYNTLSVLADYELHHSSEPADPPHTNELEAHPAGDANINPPTWDTQHNRVPPHRPTNPNLDLSTRAVYLNRVEQGFVTIMFTGVFTVHTIRNIWVATGGRINDKIFRYRIGGEW